MCRIKLGTRYTFVVVTTGVAVVLGLFTETVLSFIATTLFARVSGLLLASLFLELFSKPAGPDEEPNFSFGIRSRSRRDTTTRLTTTNVIFVRREGSTDIQARFVNEASSQRILRTLLGRRLTL